MRSCEPVSRGTARWCKALVTGTLHRCPGQAEGSCGCRRDDQATFAVPGLMVLPVMRSIVRRRRDAPPHHEGSAKCSRLDLILRSRALARRLEGWAATRHELAFSPHVSREVLPARSALLIRGHRECRAPDAPDSRACRESVRAHTRCQVTPEIARHSPRNGFTAYTRSPRRPGFLATVAPEKRASQELDASVGASGPRDFTVRIRRARQAHRPRPPHPAPRFVTLRNAPLSGAGRRGI
jgi:hypothetical protein